MELDKLDRQLLNLVQEDSAQTAERLAERIGLSPSAIQRRLKRLREDGVIVRDSAILDPQKVGRPTFFVVNVHVENERPERLTQLREWLTQHDSIQQAYYVTGETDFVLIVTARDTETYEALMARMVAENPNVKRFTTHVVMGMLKRGLTIPIALETER